jgi:hypothetical protein
MVRAMPSEGMQGDEWAAYVTLGRMTETYAGSPTGCEPYGDGEPIVVVGVASHQGVRESRTQGEVAQVIRRPKDPEGMRNCRAPKRCWVSYASAAGVVCR